MLHRGFGMANVLCFSFLVVIITYFVNTFCYVIYIDLTYIVYALCVVQGFYLCELESYKGVFYITCAIKMSENRLTTSTTGFILLTDILPELPFLYIYQDACHPNHLVAYVASFFFMYVFVCIFFVTMVYDYDLSCLFCRPTHLVLWLGSYRSINQVTYDLYVLNFSMFQILLQGFKLVIYRRCFLIRLFIEYSRPLKSIL